jgi:ABC-type glycerol-3-phosphate transport system substrate-binding protein
MSSRRLLKAFFTLVLLGSAMILAVACRGATPTEVQPSPEPEEQEPVTLHIGSVPGQQTDGFTALKEAYKEVEPNVELIIDIEDQEHWNQAGWQIISGTTPPDVAWYWCMESTRFFELGSSGALTSLDDIWDNVADAYPQVYHDYYTMEDGHKYGINLDTVWLPIIYYNKDIFTEVGIEPPETFEELYDISGKLRDAGYQPIALWYFFKTHPWGALFDRALTLEQGNMLTSNWRPGASSPETDLKWTDPDPLLSFQTYKDMVDNGVFADGTPGMDADTSNGLFYSGKAAMLMQGSWMAAADGIPGQVDFELGHFYLPPLRDDLENPMPLSAAIGNCMLIPSNAAHVEEAKEFLNWVVQTENITIWLKNGMFVPGRTDLSSEVLDELLSPLQKEILADAKEYGQSIYVPAMSFPASWYDLMDNTVLDRVFTAGMTAEEAAQMVQDEIETLRSGE